MRVLILLVILAAQALAADGPAIESKPKPDPQHFVLQKLYTTRIVGGISLKM